jgi:hypothetical protein
MYPKRLLQASLVPSAHSPRRGSWIVSNGVIGSIREMEVNNEASVLPSNEDVSLDQVVNEREVLDSGIESHQMTLGNMDVQAGVGFDKMKRYGSEMRSVRGMSTSEVLQEIWKKSKKLYNVREWRKMTRDAGHDRTWGA